MMPRPMTRIHGGRADSDVAELERIYLLEKPVLRLRDRVLNALWALAGCAMLMAIAALVIIEASQ
jgi:hypothetical protein